MNPEEPKPHMTEGYTRMIERARDIAESAGKHIEHAVDDARDMAHELGELTRDEADLLAQFVKRDLKDMGAYLGVSGHDDLRGWFVIDKTLVEARLWDLMTSVADKTSLELAELARNPSEAAVWNTGEITGPGLLVCQNCGETLEFHKPGHIPPCPRCHATTFSRQHGQGSA